MDYLVLLVVLVLIAVLYLTLNKSKSASSASDSSSASAASVTTGSFDAADTSYVEPESKIQKSSKNSCMRVGAPLCGSKNPLEYSGYNNYSTYATYYH